VIAGLGWVDWTLLAVLGVSVLVGLWRGFVFEVMSLLGWVVAWIAAQWFAVDLARHLPIGAPGSALQLAVAFVLCFAGALIVWSLIARLVRLMLHATPLSAFDRVLGAVFGLLRGGVLLLVVATVVLLTPWAKSSGWRTSHGAMWLNSALHGLKPVLPDTVARRLPA
jgi:membrane protein required for colicin V production